MSTRSAVTPPEAAAWVVTKHPEFVDVLEREARAMLAKGKSTRLADALLFAVGEFRASGRDLLASLEGAAIAQLAGGEQAVRPAPAAESTMEAARRSLCIRRGRTAADSSHEPRRPGVGSPGTQRDAQ